MAKTPVKVFVCSECSAQYAKWVGKCLECGAFASVQEVSKASLPSSSRSGEFRRPSLLKDLSFEKAEQERSRTGLAFVDRVLGDQGIPPGSVLLLAGEPGIGKSTLLFQLMSCPSDRSLLYISAEESLPQLASRFEHFQKQTSDHLYVFHESRLETILDQMQTLKPKIVVIDSIQLLVPENFDRSKGGAAGLREISESLVEKAKELGTILWIVGHVNKEGEIAGPKTLEHLVDIVVTFSMAEDSRLRILQTQKNRFGPSGEVALLEMTERGLIEQEDVSSFWTQKHSEPVSGCAVAPIVLGSRIACVEVQALVIDSYFPSPRRSASGFELNRLLVLLAVLEKRLKIPFSRSDVYLNIVGGLKISDPGADLAVAAALVSAMTERVISPTMMFCGEIGLTGEVRPPSAYADRIRYGAQSNYKTLIGSPLDKQLKINQELNWIKAESLHSALSFLFSPFDPETKSGQMSKSAQIREIQPI